MTPANTGRRITSCIAIGATTLSKLHPSDVTNRKIQRVEDFDALRKSCAEMLSKLTPSGERAIKVLVACRHKSSLLNSSPCCTGQNVSMFVKLCQLQAPFCILITIFKSKYSSDLIDSDRDGKYIERCWMTRYSL